MGSLVASSWLGVYEAYSGVAKLLSHFLLASAERGGHVLRAAAKGKPEDQADPGVVGRRLVGKSSLAAFGGSVVVLMEYVIRDGLPPGTCFASVLNGVSLFAESELVHGWSLLLNGAHAVLAGRC